MFEKDAEEWWNNEYSPSVYNNVSEVWQKGAEFGYQKGLEFGVKSNEKVNKIVANEWHYVKDELPDEGTYLVVWQNDKGYKEIFIMNYEEDDEEELRWIDGDCEVQDEYVIAWKELPKFPEENE